MAARVARRWAGTLGMALAVTALLAGCSSASEGDAPTPGSGTSTAASSPSSASNVGGTTPSSATTPSGPRTLTEAPTTITVTPTGSTTVAPPPSTAEPAPKSGTCPYLTNGQVMAANGQHTGVTTIIDTKP